jgi:hypothetical protein
MKVVDLEKLYNFAVDDFFIWNHFVKENYVWISKIWNLSFWKFLERINNQNESCKHEKVI